MWMFLVFDTRKMTVNALHDKDVTVKILSAFVTKSYKPIVWLLSCGRDVW